MTDRRRPVLGLSAVQECFLLWGLSFLAIIIGYVVGQSSVAAVFSFLYFPYFFMRKRDEDYRDYGVTMDRWRVDLKNLLLLCLLVGPIYFAGFWGFLRVLPHIPPSLMHLLTPLHGVPAFHPRLPPGFGLQVVGQVGVVAFPEEFFYRGYLLTRLKDAWPPGRTVFGIRVGKAFYVTALLFALGHLAVFRAWRLWVFFPALLFAWMRERSGTILGATLFHAFCNLFEVFLETSFQ